MVLGGRGVRRVRMECKLLQLPSTATASDVRVLKVDHKSGRGSDVRHIVIFDIVIVFILAFTLILFVVDLLLLPLHLCMEVR